MTHAELQIVLRWLAGRTVFLVDPSDLPTTLAELGCENTRAATLDFQRYGVAKFARWSRCRHAHGASYDHCTVRLVA